MRILSSPDITRALKPSKTTEAWQEFTCLSSLITRHQALSFLSLHCRLPYTELLPFPYAQNQRQTLFLTVDSLLTCLLKSQSNNGERYKNLGFLLSPCAEKASKPRVLLLKVRRHTHSSLCILYYLSQIPVIRQGGDGGGGGEKSF